MYEELEAQGLPRIRRHVYRFLEPVLLISSLMEDGLQDVAVRIGDVSILAVKRDALAAAVPVPEAQRAGTSRYRELLIEEAIPGGLGPAAAKGRRWVAPANAE
jgi:hypothetical protein